MAYYYRLIRTDANGNNPVTIVEILGSTITGNFSHTFSDIPPTVDNYIYKLQVSADSTDQLSYAARNITALVAQK